MRILIIEDDKDLCYILNSQLKNDGYNIDLCHSGEEGLIFALNNSHDLIILDRMLPVIDGLTILNTIRKKGISTPVIILTAIGSIEDKIDGLDTGADDYVVKPFDINELKARIRALSRRPKPIENPNLLKISNISLDTNKQILKSDKFSCSLSKRENDLLEYLIKNKNKTLSREQILLYVWGSNSFVEDGNLDNYIHFVRRRLKAVESNVYIKTIHSVGYCLEEKNVL